MDNLQVSLPFVIILILIYEGVKLMKNWIKEHFDTLAIMGSIVAATWTIKSDMHAMDIRLTAQIHALECRVTAIETIMIMQGAPIKAFTTEKQENNL
jgi:hypothetical protein